MSGCSVERDYHDTSAKARESQECSLKVLELQKKLEIARAQVVELSYSIDVIIQFYAIFSLL